MGAERTDGRGEDLAWDGAMEVWHCRCSRAEQINQWSRLCERAARQVCSVGYLPLLDDVRRYQAGIYWFREGINGYWLDIGGNVRVGVGCQLLADVT